MTFFRTASRASALAATALFAAGCLDDGRPRDTNIVDAWVAPRVDARASIDASTGTTADASAPDAGNDIADCSPSGAQLLANPEFDEDDESLEPWEAEGDVKVMHDEDGLYHTAPNAVAILPGVGGAANARLAQRVEIPKGTTSLQLQFFLCPVLEELRGEPDELTIAIELEGGGEGDILATFSSEDGDSPCSFLPHSFEVDPSGRYDGEVAYLVVSAETSNNDLATFFVDTFALRAACP
jgi:hypothetical protein